MSDPLPLTAAEEQKALLIALCKQENVWSPEDIRALSVDHLNPVFQYCLIGQEKMHGQAVMRALYERLADPPEGWRGMSDGERDAVRADHHKRGIHLCEDE